MTQNTNTTITNAADIPTKHSERQGVAKDYLRPESSYVTNQLDIFEGETFYDWIVRVIPIMDTDTSRFMELVWATRARAGLSTSLESIEFHENIEFDRLAFERWHDENYPVSFKTTQSLRAFLSDSDLTGSEHKELLGLFIIAGFDQRDRPAIIVVGDPEAVAAYKKRWKDSYSLKNYVEVHELNGFDGEGNPLVTVRHLLKEDIRHEACDAFYPFIELRDQNTGELVDYAMQNFAKQYKASSANFILAHGQPGTGKTTWARTLYMTQDFTRALVISGQLTTMHPAFIPWMRTQPKGSLFLIEDAHDLIATREGGNHQMAALLNLIDGAIEGTWKIIITTNIDDTNRLDSALIRPGRLFSNLKFVPLVGEEINDARIAVGKLPIEVTETTKKTLAESLNHQVANTQTKLVRGIGFGN